MLKNALVSGFRFLLVDGVMARIAPGLILSVICAAPIAAAQTQPPIIAGQARILPVLAQNGMVVSQERRASRIGVDILQRGGNAIDAAVATGFALAVTLPRAGNIGGGGFMVVHLAKDRRDVALDYRETAPDKTAADVFLDASGRPDAQKSRDSGLSVGVPGTVAGLAYAHAHWGSGKFSLADLLGPAIVLARNGFTVEDDLADSLAAARNRLATWPSSNKIFLKADGAPLGRGDNLAQSDLAGTLQKIADQGPAGFYQGESAEKIAAAVRAAGGAMTTADLQNYRVIERPAVRGSYRGREIIGMSQPSLGAPLLQEMLNILEATPFAQAGPQSAGAIHIMAEAMKFAYADRMRWLNGPTLSEALLARHMTKAYGAQIAAKISPDRAFTPAEVAILAPIHEGDQTTHFSVLDKEGNAVANTYTLNFSYGLGLVAEGTGVLLNNELDDFTASPTIPNAFGLTGGAANAPGPGKRPYSSMTPTIVLRDGRPEIITGSPGGPRIVTSVLEILTNILDFGMNVAEATIAPRFHHQGMPDELRIERGFSPDTIALLKQKGQIVVERETMGSTSTIHVVDGMIFGAADTRQRGTLAAGY